MRANRSTLGGAWARGTALAALTLTLCLAAASPAAAEWSHYRGSPDRSARAAWDGTALPTGSVAWRVEIGEDAMVDASPVVNPNTGVVYLGTTADSELAGTARLLAFSPEGSLQWAVRMWGYDVRAAPAVRRDSQLAVTGTKAVEDRDSRGDYWTFRQATFLVEPFRGTIRTAPIARDGYLGTSPVVDTRANETYVADRTYGGLSVYDWSFAQKDTVSFPPGDLEGSWGIEFPNLGQRFDKSGQAGPPRGDEPPAYERGPSPAWSGTCDQLLWTTPDGVALKGKSWRGSGRIGEAPSVTTPVFGKAGRMYVVVRDDQRRARLEAYDQRGGVRLWQSGPLGTGSVSPPAIGSGSASTGQAAMCTRVRDGVVTRVRDDRPETAYIAVGETIFAFRDDGTYLGQLRPGGELGEPVVIQRGGEELVVVPTGGSSPRLAAYRPDRTLAWRISLDGPSLGSPAVANGRIYVATTSSLYAIR